MSVRLTIDVQPEVNHLVLEDFAQCPLRRFAEHTAHLKLARFAPGFDEEWHRKRDFSAHHLDVSGGDEDISGGGDSGIDAKGDDTPVVKFVNKVLVDAIRRGASDIHFEPYETDYRVRLRIDGLLKTVARAPVKLNQRIAARLKVMAQLDIAEKRVPQDGRIKLNLSKTKQIDFRVSTLPTLFGEKVVLRILDAGAAKLGIDKLGYEPDQQKLFEEAIHKPYGMVLVTGPTGSGKTVSLYTALGILNKEERNISTVEDPVEIRLPGVNQVQQNEKRGMTFAAALRAFLRQDPDVIMVGEIRDLETAQIAVQAALTGHLVLSTVHTNSAAATIARLRDMGLEDYLLAATLRGVLAQRLVRRLCAECRRESEAPPEMVRRFGLDRRVSGPIRLWHPVGCAKCRGTGYRGRLAIAEFLRPSPELERLIFARAETAEIERAAVAGGMIPMFDAGLDAALAGTTTVEEVVRSIRAEG